ncbi:O-antigen ligase family protein [bacterium]|nr:O-antigen ligase family protein [bacterium]
MIEPTAPPLNAPSRKSKYSRGLPPWILTGDALAELVIYAILVGGMASHGYAELGIYRVLAWLGCGLLGVWAAIGIWLNRWRGSHLRTSRWILSAFGVMIVWTGFQTIPLPAGLVMGLNPAWKEIQQSFQSTGLEFPTMIPLALNPDRAIWSWDQLVAAGLFFAGVALLTTRRRCSNRLIIAVALVSLTEGIWGFLRFAAGGQPHAIGALFNPSHHAALVLAGIPLFMVWTIDLSRRSEVFSGGLFSGSNPLLIAVGAGLIAMMGWATSYSRGGLVLGGAVLLIWVIIEVWGARNEGPRDDAESVPFSLTAVGVGGTILLLLAVAGLVYSASLLEGISSLQWETGERQGLGRFELWRATLEGLGDSPWTGLGLGGTENALTRYSVMPMRTDPIWSHGDYVQILAELGIPIALVVGLLFSKALLSFWRDTRQRWEAFEWPDRIMTRAAMAGLIALLIHAGVDFHLRIPLVGFVALILLALSINDGPLFIVSNSSSGRR